jgi:hypothetical protein
MLDFALVRFAMTFEPRDAMAPPLGIGIPCAYAPASSNAIAFISVSSRTEGSTVVTTLANISFCLEKSGAGAGRSRLKYCATSAAMKQNAPTYRHSFDNRSWLGSTFLSNSTMTTNTSNRPAKPSGPKPKRPSAPAKMPLKMSAIVAEIIASPRFKDAKASLQEPR